VSYNQLFAAALPASIGSGRHVYINVTYMLTNVFGW